MLNLATILLRDERGLSETAWRALQDVIYEYQEQDTSSTYAKALDVLIWKVKENNGRFFLPDD